MIFNQLNREFTGFTLFTSLPSLKVFILESFTRKLLHDKTCAWHFFILNNLNVCEGHVEVYGKYAIIFTMNIQYLITGR